MKTEIKVTLQMHLKKRSKFAFCLSMCGTQSVSWGSPCDELASYPGIGILLGRGWRKEGGIGGGNRKKEGKSEEKLW